MKENPNPGLGCCLLPVGLSFGFVVAGVAAALFSFLPSYLLGLIVLAGWGLGIWAMCFWLPRNLKL